MKVMRIIKPTYEVYHTYLDITNKLEELSKIALLSFDLETRSRYNKSLRKELKLMDTSNPTDYEYAYVANSSGLSHPSISKVTHIIFGVSNSHSVVLVTKTTSIVKLVFNYMLTMDTKFLVHNAQFDMKIFNFYTGKFLTNYEDTQLMVLNRINDTNDYRRKSGLKHLMSDYYIASWDEDTDYEVEDLFDKSFLTYCACDGCSTYLLYEQLMEGNNDGM